LFYKVFRVGEFAKQTSTELTGTRTGRKEKLPQLASFPAQAKKRGRQTGTLPLYIDGQA